MPIIRTVLATTVDEATIPSGGGSTQGDRLVWTDDVTDDVTDTLVGQHSGECVLVREPNVWKCEAGWTFLEGNLVAGGLITFDENIPTFSTAIYGGTGAYKDARGQITGTKVDLPSTQTRYALEILP